MRYNLLSVATAGALLTAGAGCRETDVPQPERVGGYENTLTLTLDSAMRGRPPEILVEYGGCVFKANAVELDSSQSEAMYANLRPQGEEPCRALPRHIGEALVRETSITADLFTASGYFLPGAVEVALGSEAYRVEIVYQQDVLPTIVEVQGGELADKRGRSLVDALQKSASRAG